MSCPALGLPPPSLSGPARGSALRARWGLAVLLLSVAPANGAAAELQEPDDPSGPPALLDVSAPVRVDELLAPLLAAHALPAVGGAVVREGRLAALGVAGVRRVGSDVAVAADDLWHLGSCTKAMTATLVGRLVEQGTLDFARTLGDALGDEAHLELHADWRPVTLGDLLRHRGRAPADLDRGGLWQELWRREGLPREQRTRLLRGVLGEQPRVPSGELVYSNAGYAIAGALAERADGRDFERLLLEELARPLGAGSLGFGPPGVAGELDQPRGHRRLLGRLVAVEPGPAADNPPAIAPAGTAHASLADWARFVDLHLRGARGEPALLQPETFAALHEPHGEHALGWIVTERDWADGRALTHAGSNTMWYAVVWIAPRRDLALLAVTNRGGDGAVRGCDAAIGALLNWASENP